MLPGGEKAPTLELTGEVPLDSSVREAVQKRQLMIEMLPGSAATRAIEATAAKIAP